MAAFHENALRCSVASNIQVSFEEIDLKIVLNHSFPTGQVASEVQGQHQAHVHPSQARGGSDRRCVLRGVRYGGEYPAPLQGRNGDSRELFLSSDPSPLSSHYHF